MKCPIKDCEHPVLKYPTCSTHWWLVPRVAQVEINEAKRMVENKVLNSKQRYKATLKKWAQALGWKLRVVKVNFQKPTSKATKEKVAVSIDKGLREKVEALGQGNFSSFVNRAIWQALK